MPLRSRNRRETNSARRLTPKQPRAVLAGAAASVTLVLFAAWMPVERRVSHLEDSVRTKQADLLWLRSVAPRPADNCCS